MIKEGALTLMLVLLCMGIGYMYASTEARENHRVEITAAANAVARASKMCRVHFAQL